MNTFQNADTAEHVDLIFQVCNYVASMRALMRVSDGPVPVEYLFSIFDPIEQVLRQLDGAELSPPVAKVISAANDYLQALTVLAATANGNVFCLEHLLWPLDNHLSAATGLIARQRRCA